MSAMENQTIQWDPDFTRVTDEEKRRIDTAIEEMKNGIYFSEDEVWN